MSKLCADCCSFRQLPDKKDVIGQCRYNPPKPGHASRDHARDKNYIFAEWPVVFGDDWCRKFKKKKADQAQPVSDEAQVPEPATA